MIKPDSFHARVAVYAVAAGHYLGEDAEALRDLKSRAENGAFDSSDRLGRIVEGASLFARDSAELDPSIQSSIDSEVLVALQIASKLIQPMN